MPVTLPITGPYTTKDQRKANIANNGMNIIELAKQAGFTANDEQEVFLRVYREEIERFATLVRNTMLEDMRDVLKEAAQVCRDLDDEALARENRLACGAECAAAVADLAARWNVPFGEQEAPFTCKYCGQPSWIDPSDQSPPPDYCHEIDHGTAEDRTGS